MLGSRHPLPEGACGREEHCTAQAPAPWFWYLHHCQQTDVRRDLTGNAPPVSAVPSSQPLLGRERGWRAGVSERACPSHTGRVLSLFSTSSSPGDDWKGHSGMTDTNSSLFLAQPTRRVAQYAEWEVGRLCGDKSKRCHLSIYTEGPCPHLCITQLTSG